MFIICKNWKQSNYPSTWECINRLWYSHTVALDPQMRSNESLMHTTQTNSKHSIMGSLCPAPTDTSGCSCLVCGLLFNGGSLAASLPTPPPRNKLGALYRPLPPKCKTQKCVQNLPNVPCWAKSASAEN